MDKIDEFLTRGVDKIYPTKEELEKLLRGKRKLKAYQGFDPTSPELHIGHMAGLRKLRQWQNLGHKVIFLIGDFTATVGDPTGKDKRRKVLTKEEVIENAKTYKQQASKILDFEGDNPVIIKYNSDWLAKLSASELIHLTTYLSYQQIIERDMFQRRLKNNMDIALNEFLYPFMQGYDSVAMDVDLEIGGTDQLFNMLMGRTLMHKIKRRNKFVMTLPLLEDSEGRKIGKTEGNTIAFNDTAGNIFAKSMALGDEVIVKGLECLTDLSIAKTREIKEAIENGQNPIQYKKILAYEITKQLTNEENAQNAQDIFEGKAQANIPIVNVPLASLTTVAGTIVASGLLQSMSETKRKFNQGAIRVNGELPESLKTKVEPGSIISVGRNKVGVNKK